MKRLLASVALFLISCSAFAQTIVGITAIPTPGGIVSSKFRDGDDGGSAGPSAPQIGTISVLSDTDVNVPLTTACTGGTAPLVYELSLSTTSELAGFSVVDASAEFDEDGIYLLSGLTAETEHWIRPACIDDDARRSEFGSVRTFTTAAVPGGDSTAPSDVTGLAAVSNDPGEATVTWNAATDNVAVTGYDILRGAADGASNPVGEASVIFTGWPTTTYDDSGLIGGGQYYYRLKARDAAGNTSAASTNRQYVTILGEDDPAAEFPGVILSNFEGMTVGAAAQDDANWQPLSDPGDSNAGFISATNCRTGIRCFDSTIDRDEEAGQPNERNEVRWSTPTHIPSSLTASPSGNIYTSDEDAWFGFSVFVPSNWRAIWKRDGAGNPQYSSGCNGPIVFQLHNSNSGSDQPASDAEGNPSYTITLLCTPQTSSSAVPSWQVQTAVNTNVPNTDSTTSTTTTNTRAARLGEWTDFVLQLNHDPFNGYCRVYIKDSTDSAMTLYHTRTGGCGYAKQNSQPYIKIGGYLSLWNVQKFPTRITANSSNVEVREITLKFDETRYYDDTTLSTTDGVLYVSPR